MFSLQSTTVWLSSLKTHRSTDADKENKAGYYGFLGSQPGIVLASWGLRMLHHLIGQTDVYHGGLSSCPSLPL